MAAPVVETTFGMSLVTLEPGRVGGAESYIRGLLEGLAKTSAAPRVLVFANAAVVRSYQPLATGGVHFQELPYRLANNSLLAAARRLVPTRLAPRSAEGVGVVHYPLPLVNPRTALPTVVTLHDVLHHEMPETFSRHERIYRWWTYDRAARGASMVITDSEFAKQQILHHLGIPEERVVAIPHGVDHSRFRPAEEVGDREIRAHHRLSREYVFYPANLWPHKNHGRLLEAFAAEDRDFDLVFTGQPYGRLEELQSQATALGIQAGVRHLGYVPAGHVAPLYRQAIALMFPSLHEGFGYPPLEAMACGCPVASSASGSLREILGDAALRFDATDVDAISEALTRIVSDLALRERLRQAGLAQSARYDWNRSAELHLEVYAKASKGTAGRRRR